jgi:hypothetical protein
VELPFLKGLMPQQKRFTEDESRFKSLLAPRRAGKTRLNNAYLFQAGLRPETVAKAWVNRGVPPIVRYWAPTKDRAKEMMWRPLIRFAEEFNIECTPRESEQTIFLPNGGEIRLVGADKDKDAQKKRGDPTVLEVVDEAPVYGSFLRSLMEDVIEPSLDDFIGTACIMGTPGIVWDGFWFGVSGPAEGEKRIEGWSRHWFDSFDNTYLPHLKRTALEKKENKKWGDDHPTWRREYRGEWVNDLSAMYFQWSSARNTYRELPKLPEGERWEYVLGWDLGNPKNQALTAWAFTRHEPELYEVYSKRGFERRKNIATQVKLLEKQLGRPFTYKVADAGGLGGEVIKEFGEQYRIWFEHAKKTDKFQFVTEFNGELLSGVIKTLPDSELSNELLTLPKDPEDETEPMKGESFSDHCAHAAVYAWRRAKHWDAKPREDEPEAGTEAALVREAERTKARVIARVKGRKGKAWWQRKAG